MRILSLTIFAAIWFSCLFAPGRIYAQDGNNTVVISEFLANYSGELESEWIELHNPNRSVVDLSQYQIGDALSLKTISDTTLLLPGPNYIVLVQDKQSFLEYYSNYDGMLVELSSWPVLNNSGGDMVRLATLDGEIIDTVAYTDVFVDNRSWERYISSDGQSYWGKSYAPDGSSPGKPNTFFPNDNTTIDMRISPNPFSPDGDGFEDECIISYTPPNEGSFTLSVYDISGRKIKSCLESVDAIPGEYTWDGCRDDGRRCPIGIYVVYAKIEGDNPVETKLTVAIAR